MGLGSGRRPCVAGAVRRAARGRGDAHARALVRDPHDRVPLPRAARRDELGRAHERHRRASRCRCPTWSVDYQNWPFYYTLIGPARGCRSLLSWWIRRTKFGMGLIAIREDEDKAATVGVNTPDLQDPRVRRERRLRRRWRAASTATTSASSTRSGCSTSCSACRSSSSLLLGGRGHALGAGARRVHHRAAQRDRRNNEFGGGNARLLIFGGLLALVVLFLPRASSRPPTIGSSAGARAARPAWRASV